MENFSNNPQENRPLKLKIDANVVRQLGAELISGPEIAVLELIKNSFDADADYCQVDIDPNYVEIINGKAYQGKISIKDNGSGMSRETINSSWLTISYSAKREAKSAGEKTKKKNRPYTGDKGLGRLGTMRLADICRIRTHNTENEQGFCVTFCWLDFHQGITLDQINIQEQFLDKQSFTGSTIEMIGLCDLSYWTNSKTLTEFQYAISSMVSPYEKIKEFIVSLSIKGIEIKLEEFSENLLSLNISEFSFNLINKILTVNGSVKLAGLEPPNSKDEFRKYVLADSGEALFNYLLLCPRYHLPSFSQKKASNNKYFIDFKSQYTFDEIDNNYIKECPIYPGDFSGKIYNFKLEKSNLEDGLQGIEKWSEAKTLLKNLLGTIHLYRDGFRVGSGNEDWLELGKELTSGAASYSLRPGNTAGYISLSWEKNPSLVDKSDRESLIENEAYLTFKVICKKIVEDINKYLNGSRRAVLDFLKECKNIDEDKPKDYSADDAQTALKNLTVNAKKIYQQRKKQVSKNDLVFEKQTDEFKKFLFDSKQDLFGDPKLINTVEKIEEKFVELQKQFKQMQTEQLNMLREFANHDSSVEVVIDEIATYKQKIVSFYDHVAIGLSAQYLAHDANSQISHITEHTQFAIKRSKELAIKDTLLTRYHLAIKSDAQALSKTVSILHPLVRAQREELRELNICDEINSYVDYISSYLETEKIKTSIIQNNDCKVISFNAGKFFQIIDNIVRNSEYWLNSYAKHRENFDKIIYIDIDKYKVTIWDNGKGIRPGIESYLFDMFVTDKEHGQGLGLYIVKTLLEEKGCSIFLLDERNEHGRRYKFQIIFNGAAA